MMDANKKPVNPMCPGCALFGNDCPGTTSEVWTGCIYKKPVEQKQHRIPIPERVYFEGWFSGSYVKAEDWYKDDLVYINIRSYSSSTAISRPDSEKSFLVRFDDREKIPQFANTIAKIFISREESLDAEGRLAVHFCRLPDPLRAAPHNAL